MLLWLQIDNASYLICFLSEHLNVRKRKSYRENEKEREKGRTPTFVLCFNIIHRLSDGRVVDPQLNTNRVLPQKKVKLGKIGNIEISTFPGQLYKCSRFAFMFVFHPVRYIPGRYVSSHNHTTMDNQKMS